MAENSDNYEIVPNKKAKSEIWNHFGLKFDTEKKTFLNGIAICKLCNGTVKYSGGTTNLNTHIDRHHPSVVKSKVGSFSHEYIRTDLDLKKQKTFHGMLKAKYEFNSDRAVAITRSIGRYIIDDLRPLSVVEGRGFQNMIKTLDPHYCLPGKTYFSQTLFPTMYEETITKVKSTLSLARMVALTGDEWTSHATESYVTITSFHISSDWTLQKLVLQTTALPESHSGVNIADVIREAISEWGIPTFNPPLVSDNAANMVVAGKELFSKHIGCLAHTLNFSAQNALKDNTVSRILCRVREIVSFFHRSSSASAVLKTQAKLYGINEVKLVCDVPTRWNSAAEMLECFLQLQSAIYATLVSTNVNAGDESGINALSEAETRLAEEIMNCLAPLKDMTEAICAEKTLTVSVILPLIQKIQKIMAVKETDSPTVKSLKEAVTGILEARYAGEELKNFLEECTVLDPRFKDLYFKPGKLQDIFYRLSWLLHSGEEHVQVKFEVEAEATTTSQQQTSELHQLAYADQPSTSGDTSEPEVYSRPELCRKSVGLASIFDDIVVKEENGEKTVFDKVDEEINKYKMTPQISVQSDPLVWWKDNSIYFPLLANLVKGRLCIPATSIPSDWIFSAAGDIVTSHRASLSHDLVDMMIFLKENSF